MEHQELGTSVLGRREEEEDMGSGDRKQRASPSLGAGQDVEDKRK